MWIKGQRRRRGEAGPVLALLALAIAVAALRFWPAPAGRPGASPNRKAQTVAVTPMAPWALGATEGRSGELARLEVEIRERDWQVLARARERAMARGMIVQDAQDVVPAALSLGEERVLGTARLKGDWLDHVDTDQWSLRFETDRPIGGMRRFSIQHPKTRGYVMEWLVMQAARREGVLAPRSDFVRVSINGQEKGVYYLEEHFGKEMLESQGRRDGPIVRFDESGMWATWLQHGFHKTGILSPDLWPAASFYDARVDGFGEARLIKSTSLGTRLLKALAQARDLQRMAVAEIGLDGYGQRKAQALLRLQGRTIDDLFAADRTGKWLAIYTLFRGFHGLAWHQYRFYHDPVLDRLEPIVFDTGASFLMHEGELALSSPEARWFRSSEAVIRSAFRELGRLTSPGWAEAFVRDLRPRLVSIGAALEGAGIVVPGIDIGLLLDVLFPKQVRSLAEIVRPVVAIGLSSSVVGVRKANGEDERAIEVEAWAATTIPTEVTGFRFGNGRVVGASEAFVGVIGEEEEPGRDPPPGNAVLLPPDGRQVLFRFPIDRRLAGLTEIEEIKRAIRASVQPTPTGKVEVKALYRTLAEDADREEDLIFRRVPDPQAVRIGRPKPPSLLEALQRHPFLHYDFDRRELSIEEGSHSLHGDLVLPEGMALYVRAGTEILFPPGAVLLCSAIVAEGTKEAPIRIGASDKARGFGGVVVIGNGEKSRLSFVEFDSAAGVERGGWQTTGGVTFHRVPVEFTDCVFRDALGEDSLNLISTRFRCERCSFQGGPHDLLDGDFVNGEIRSCSFAGSGEDAIDLSGSQVRVTECVFEDVGDKALSIGENSTVTAERCRVSRASIAAASKDRSSLTVRDLIADQVENFVFAVYVKKPEFGAARLLAERLRWTGAGPAPHLAQYGCSLSIDGTDVPTRAVDVEDLYRRKVLGK